MCDLSDWDSNQLKAALKSRGLLDEWEAVDILEARGCPPELLAPVREWADHPVVGEGDLADYLNRLPLELSKKS